MISKYTKQEIILNSHREGKSKREISRELGISRKTVTKYISEFESRLSQSASPEATVGEQLSIAPKYDTANRTKRKLTSEVIKIIDALLEENEKNRQKGLRNQLLKNSDIHEHLENQGFDIGYTTVCSYISLQKGKTREP